MISRLLRLFVILNITLATRMATVGRIKEFNPEKKQISAYLERVELFFIANGAEAITKAPTPKNVTEL